MGLDGSFGQEQLSGNSTVGQTLRNEGEDAALALGQRVDASAALHPERRDEGGNHGWIQRRSAGRDTLQRVQKVVHPQYGGDSGF